MKLVEKSVPTKPYLAAAQMPTDISMKPVTAIVTFEKTLISAPVTFLASDVVAAFTIVP